MDALPHPYDRTYDRGIRAAARERAMTAPRVLIVDDHALFAEAIRLALGNAGIEVVGIASSVKDGLRIAGSTKPDLALVDIDLPDGDGLSLGRAILEQHGVEVVIVSALQDARAVQDALRAGFRGYIVKNTPLNRFVASVAQALDGDVVIPRDLAGRVAGARTTEEDHVALVAALLTPRELEVLELLVAGASGDRIATELGISPNTVRTHVQNVLHTLQVNSRLEAATFAARHGIVDVVTRRSRVAER